MTTGEKKNWSDIWDNFAIVTQKLALDADCIDALAQTQTAILSNQVAIAAVQAAEKALFANEETVAQEQLGIAAKTVGTDVRTITAVMLIGAIPAMLRLYQEMGIDRSILWDTLIDLKCKLEESHNLHGVWGTAAIGWYIRLFRGKIIKLGRLEFEPVGYKWDTPYGDICKGDPVMNVHIPPTGPLWIQDVLESFGRAFCFFGYQRPMPVAVASWLLYPPICETVMKPGSNMRNFYELFDVVEQYEDPDNRNFWRVFNMEYAEGALDKVPLDNSLRRGIYDYMKSGRHMGIGRCMLLFDGERVMNK